jgi:hypothetical protein
MHPTPMYNCGGMHQKFEMHRCSEAGTRLRVPATTHNCIVVFDARQREGTATGTHMVDRHGSSRPGTTTTSSLPRREVLRLLTCQCWAQLSCSHWSHQPDLDAPPATDIELAPAAGRGLEFETVGRQRCCREFAAQQPVRFTRDVPSWVTSTSWHAAPRWETTSGRKLRSVVMLRQH